MVVLQPLDNETGSAYIEQLTHSWREQAATDGDFKMRRKNLPAHQVQFAIVYALSSHVHSIGETLLPACKQGLSLVDIPQVRAAYECAITAQWVAQIPDGFKALMNAEVKNRRNLRDTMAMSASVVFRDGTSSFPHADDPLLASDVDSRAFEQRCLDLEPGGHDAYAIYRVLSGATHPGVFLSDRYLEAGADGRLTLKPDAGVAHDQLVWTPILCSSLVWAGRAVDFFDQTKARRSELRAVAKAIGIESELKPSSAYRARIARQRKAEHDGRAGL